MSRLIKAALAVSLALAGLTACEQSCQRYGWEWRWVNSFELKQGEAKPTQRYEKALRCQDWGDSNRASDTDSDG